MNNTIAKFLVSILATFWLKIDVESCEYTFADSGKLKEYLNEKRQIIKLNQSCKFTLINVSSDFGQRYPSGAELFKIYLADAPHYTFTQRYYIHLLNDTKLIYPIDWGKLENYKQLLSEVE